MLKNNFNNVFPSSAATVTNHESRLRKIFQPSTDGDRSMRSDERKHIA